MTLFPLIFLLIVATVIWCAENVEEKASSSAVQVGADEATMRDAAASEIGGVFLAEHVPSKLIGLRAKVTTQKASFLLHRSS